MYFPRISLKSGAEAKRRRPKMAFFNDEKLAKNFKPIQIVSVIDIYYIKRKMTYIAQKSRAPDLYKVVIASHTC